MIETYVPGHEVTVAVVAVPDGRIEAFPHCRNCRT